MASIESMLMGASTDDEKARMLADALRGQKRAADVFSMSTLSPIAGAAQAESQSVMDSAKRGGALRQTRLRDEALKAQRDQAQSNWDKRFAYDRKKDAADREALLKKSTGRTGGLSAGQTQTGLDKLEKKLAPVQRLIGQTNIIDNMLKPYASGGKKAGKNIPGVGLIEGDRGYTGQAIRLMQGDEALNINSAMAAFISDVLKMKAGTAQTLQETRNVLLGMGQQALTDEDAVLAAWPRIKSALRTDLDRLEASTYPEVLDQFKSSYASSETEDPFDYSPPNLDFGSDVTKGSGLIPNRKETSSPVNINVAPKGESQEEWNQLSQEDKELLWEDY